MNSHTFSFSFILFLLISQSNIVLSQTPNFPKPDHIVILIMENHSFDNIIGSSAAPYINSLVNDTSSALFTGSYGITHPSQPNYLALFSGSTQGVTDDLFPSGSPFTTPNIGSQLISSGNTFSTYSEDLPSVGYSGETSDNYVRKHNPEANWMGNGTNQVSPTTNQPFTAFPSSDFKALPTVSFVFPNTLNDMHDGTDPETITTGDNWLSTNLDNYIQWAKKNNSLFILTFDEDNNLSSNHITTIFTGQMVKSGQYSNAINHFTILHTIEKMYGLPYIGDAVSYSPIIFSWKQKIIHDTIPVITDKIYPNPASDFLYIQLAAYQNANANIFNLKGQLVQVQPLVSKETQININNLSTGLYVIKIEYKNGVILRKFIKK